MLSLPYSRNKRYLTGIDWIVHVLNYMTIKETGAGFMSQIVIEVSGNVNAPEIENALNSFIKKHAVVNGYFSRDINLAPYWKIPPVKKPEISLDTAIVKEGESFDVILNNLENGINTLFKNKREHIAFHVLTGCGRSYIAMTFDHLLFDARNAEAFLNMFQEEWESGEASGNMTITEPAHLSMWMDKFKAGQRVNRTFIKIAGKAPPRALPLPSGKNGFKFRVLSFDRKETEAICENAFNEAGYLMLMPYALAASVCALHEIFKGRGISSGDFVIPVSIDTRKQEEITKQLFFNHISFFIFKAEASAASDFQALLKSIKEQMYTQVRSDLPGDICKATLLMRIAPAPLLGRLLKIYFKGEIASFCFSYVGKTAYTSPYFMGNKITNIFHMPRTPVPPGIGIFFQQSNEKLNVILSYLDKMLSADEEEVILTSLKSRLGVE
ncbi:MAG: hypothetical protein Q8M56_15480 [Desulfobacterales bacterium]|nr:hypothetical protein [Desulfobacterales bacterium]